MTKNLGTIVVGSKHVVMFDNPYPSRSVYKIKSSCGCSKPKVKGNKIQVTFKVKAIPKHLSFQGYYFKTSYITVTYDSGQNKILYIKAKIVNNGVSV